MHQAHLLWAIGAVLPILHGFTAMARCRSRHLSVTTILWSCIRKLPVVTGDCVQPVLPGSGVIGANTIAFDLTPVQLPDGVLINPAIIDLPALESIFDLATAP